MISSRQKAQGNTARLSLKGKILNKALESENKSSQSENVYGKAVSTQGHQVEVSVIKASPKVKKAFHHKDKAQGASKKGFKFKVKDKQELTQGSQSRASAALIITAVEKGTSLQEALPLYLENLDERDKAFCAEIVHGTLRYRRLLTFNLKKLLTVKIPDEYRNAQNLMLCGLYQLLFMRSPAHAVVAATVGASSLCHCRKYTSVINAVLRRFLREGAQLQHSDDPAVENSFPDWLCIQLIKAYGQDKACKIMENSNLHPPMWLRVSEDKITRDEYAQYLDSQNLSFKVSDLSSSAIKLEEPLATFNLPKFNQGLVSVQDLSAQLAAPLLIANDLKPNANKEPLKILDCCAAPGGKTAHLLALSPNSKVTAVELDKKRALSIHNTLDRLGLKAQVIETDATTLSENPLIEGPFERILVDAPCSGTGVIRRHPDIKWLRREKDLENLTKTQAKILDEAYKLLAPGGILLYTTCSILPSENQEQIRSFLERHSDLKLSPFAYKGENVSMLQRLPNEDEGDGFFYARLIKS